MKKEQAIFLTWILLGLLLPKLQGQETSTGISFRGQLKPIAGVRYLNQENLYPDSIVSYNEDRLRLSVNLSKDWFYLEIADETRFQIEKENPSSFPISSFDSVPFWNASWNISEQSNSYLVTRLDRAFVQASFENFETRVGKQVVPIGVGHIFTSVSQTPRYPFVIVDPEYDKTEDAITVLWKKGLRLEARYLPKNRGQEKDNYHLRWFFNALEMDIALIAGQSDDKYFSGIESTRNLGGAVLRAELVLYEKNTVYYAQGLLGWDRVWNSKWASQHEFFYNGFGKSGAYALESFSHRSSNFRGKFYWGNLLSYEWNPKLKLNFLSIVNILDPSFLLHLYANYSLSDNVDLMAGHYQNLATKDNAEFGGRQEVAGFPAIKAGLPNLSYLLLKWTF